MKTTKKILIISSLSTLAISCAILISAVFGAKVFDGTGALLRILLISSTLCVGSAISINELNIINRKKILGYVSLGFLIISVLFAIIIFSTNILNGVSTASSNFAKVTEILSVFSILFIIIVTLFTKLDKKQFVLQIITYCLVMVIDIFITLEIVGIDVFKNKIVTDIFIVLCIVSVGLIIALLVLSPKKFDETKLAEKDKIVVSKEEYENIKKENEELKKQLENFKQIQK